VGGYENTSRLPDLETLKKIAQLFDISLDYVAGYTDVPYTLKKRREISDEEMRFMSVYRQLNAAEKAALYELIRLLVEKK
jgi:transcriptional regulator